MSKKQTAVEWLISELQRLPLEHRMEKAHLFFHAKQMEKEQIIESYCTGCLHMAEDETIFPRETSDRYYETTYGDPPPPKPHIPFIYR